MTDYLFDNSNQIINGIKQAKYVFIFLDYDGTLISFQKRPQDVRTPLEVISILNQLIHHPAFTVFVITGRPLQEIKRFLPLKGLSYAGLHGIEIEWENGETFFWRQASIIKTILKKIKKQTETIFRNQQEIIIEDKTYSLAFHYRLLPEKKVQPIIETIESISKELDKENQLQLIYGAKVVELRPQGWNKGHALNMLLQKHPSSEHVLPIYIGDDATDEDAFKQINNQGVTIYVQNNDSRQTAAKYYVSSPDDVLLFLRSLSTIQLKN